jgi:hypothetical protein
MMDGGGGGANFYKISSHISTNQFGVKIRNNFMINKFDLNDKIFLLNCNVHILKNLRNALRQSGYESSDGTMHTENYDISTKQLKFNESPIMWQTILDEYRKDKNAGNGYYSSGLSADIVNPDGFLAMRVMLAKAIFSEKLITYIIADCLNILGKLIYDCSVCIIQ